MGFQVGVQIEEAKLLEPELHQNPCRLEVFLKDSRIFPHTPRSSSSSSSSSSKTPPTTPQFSSKTPPTTPQPSSKTPPTTPQSSSITRPTTPQPSSKTRPTTPQPSSKTPPTTPQPSSKTPPISPGGKGKEEGKGGWGTGEFEFKVKRRGGDEVVFRVVGEGGEMLCPPLVVDLSLIDEESEGKLLTFPQPLHHSPEDLPSPTPLHLSLRFSFKKIRQKKKEIEGKGEEEKEGGKESGGGKRRKKEDEGEEKKKGDFVEKIAPPPGLTFEVSQSFKREDTKGANLRSSKNDRMSRGNIGGEGGRGGGGGGKGGRERLTAKDAIAGEVWEGLGEKEKKRQDVLYETVVTEKRYVEDLKLFLENVANPMKEQGLVNQAKQLLGLFGTLSSILSINEAFANDLQKRQKEDNFLITTITDLYEKHTDMFSMYIVYCGAHTTAIEELKEKVMKDEAGVAFVKKNLQEEWMRKLSLETFLIMPLQRVCKYPLLLRELIKVTEGEELKQLEEIEERMKKTVNQANERTRKVESLQKLVEMQTILDFSSLENRGGIAHDSFTLVGSNREFEGEVVCLMPDTEKELCLFLFNDLLILASPPLSAKKRKHKVKKVIPIVSLLCRFCSVSPLIVWVISYDSALTLKFSNQNEALKWVKQVNTLAHNAVENELETVGEEHVIAHMKTHYLELGYSLRIPAPIAEERLQTVIYQQRLKKHQLNFSFPPPSPFPSPSPSPSPNPSPAYSSSPLPSPAPSLTPSISLPSSSSFSSTPSPFPISPSSSFSSRSRSALNLIEGPARIRSISFSANKQHEEKDKDKDKDKEREKEKEKEKEKEEKDKEMAGRMKKTTSFLAGGLPLKGHKRSRSVNQTSEKSNIKE